jgi:hypothetical protein
MADEFPVRGASNAIFVVPDDSFGQFSSNIINQTTERMGMELVETQYYSQTDAALYAAIRRLGKKVKEYNKPIEFSDDSDQAGAGFTNTRPAIIIPEGGHRLTSIIKRLRSVDITPSNTLILGSGQWDDALVTEDKNMVGGIYASSPPDAWQNFSDHFEEVYSYAPVRIASLAYDGVALASLLAKQDNFSKSAIMSKRGFSGVNGLFRFNIDGLPDRTLTILQITKKGPEIIEAAPRSFSRY